MHKIVTEFMNQFKSFSENAVILDCENIKYRVSNIRRITQEEIEELKDENLLEEGKEYIVIEYDELKPKKEILKCG